MKKALILGAGFSGCTMAHLLVKEGWDCTVIEKTRNIGGGCRTLFYGGHPYTEGPRPYYGYSQKIYDWIDSFVEMRKFPFYLYTFVEQENRFFSYPIHEAEIPYMKNKEKICKELELANSEKEPKDFEEYWINRVGKTLYDMFVNEYSKKMWMIDSNKELDTFKWSAKDYPIETKLNKECYKGSIVGYPVSYEGYNPYFRKTVEGSTLILNEEAKNINLENKSVTLSNGTELKGDVLISSIPIDDLCGLSKGELPYMGREFIPFVLPCKQVFPADIRFCHYSQLEPYTRIVEYKKLTYYESEDTLLVMEFPSKKNKLYPLMKKKYLNIASEYLNELTEDVYSIGRLGTYLYSTIEQTLAQCFSVYKKITGKSHENMEKEFYNIGDVGIIISRKSEDDILKKEESKVG